MDIETPKQTHPQDIDPAIRAAIRGSLHDWYEENKRRLPWRETSDPYAIWISEVMLQQTRVQTVIPYYRRFLEKFPDPWHLAAADLESVYKLWEGLGYYSRARHLHQAANTVASEMGGRLPADPAAIRRLPGIGEYIAAAIASIAFGLPYAVVDGNVKRVLARLFCIDFPVNQNPAKPVFQIIADQLSDEINPGRHNQAVMELGALVCTPRNPRCSQCPVARFCKAYERSLTDQYPRREKRPAPPWQHWVAGVVVKNGHVLMSRRPATGLLAGFWEFPCIAINQGDDFLPTLVDAIRKTTGIHTCPASHITTIGHAYTHFKLKMDVYLCRYESGRVRLNGPDAFSWRKPAQIKTLPLHKAVHKALPAIQKKLDE